MNHRFLTGAAGLLIALSSAHAAVPSAPTNLSARPAGPTSLILEWSDTSANETGFRLERQNGPGWDPVATLDTDTQSHTLTGLAAASSDTYRALAFNLDGDSSPSNPITGETTIKTNLIFFLADDMGVKDIVALRDPATDGPTIYETPNLDQFVAQSTRFNRAYCSGPKCVVSRRAMLTGMYDFRDEAIATGGGIGNEMITFGEAMQSGGYDTCYIGKWHLGGAPDHPDRMPAQQGFDVSIAAGEFGSPNPSYFPELIPASSPAEYDFNLPNLGPTSDPDEYLTDRLTNEATGYISTHLGSEPGKPFFLTLAHYAVHTPLEAKQADIAYFTTRKANLAATLATHPKANDPFETDYSNRGRNIQDQVVYAAMMKSFDDSLASLRAYLAATDDPRNPGKKLSETTAIILSSDHGGKSGFWAGANPKDDQIPTANYPLRYGKTWCYEGGLRIPLIVYWPGVSQANVASNALVHGADFYTTFLDIGAAPKVPAQHKDSLSFAQSISHPKSENRTESFHWFNNAETGTGNTGLGAYLKGDYKLVYHIHRRIKELYNLKEDPRELRDIAAVRPDLAEEMFRALNAKRAEVGKNPAKPSSNGWQKEIQVLTPIMTIPPIPDADATNLTGTAISATAIDLIWTDNSSNEEFFIIERKPATGSFQEITYLTANTTSYRDTGLEAGTIYKYRLQTESLGGWAATPPTTANITTLAAGNHHPLSANDDSITALSNEAREFAPLINDEGDALTIQSITQPSNGTAVLDGSSIRYTPSPDFTGSDTLTYIVLDAANATQTATVNLDVLANNDPPAPPSTFGAYWAFQNEQGGRTSGDSTYSDAVTYHNLATAPLFSRTGDRLATFAGANAYNFTHFGGDNWERGRTATWNGNAGASANNTFQITLDTTGAENFVVRFSYRNNGLSLGGQLITSMVNFEYKVGAGGTFTAVPAAPLALTNNTQLNTWTMNLSPLSAVENIGEVTLRWTLSDFDQGASTQIRIDDLQITGTAVGPAPPRDRLLPEGNFNVLFLPIDDLKPLINAYGEDAPLRPITPNMDRLAARGITFTNAHCQQAICNASRASIMTGMRPDYTRCWKLETLFRDIRPNVTTIPQHFGNNGYLAKGIGKIYHGINSTKQDAALSWNDGWVSGAAAHNYYEPAKAALEDGGTNNPSATDAGEVKRNGNPIEDIDYSDGNATELGMQQIATYAAGGQPFFLAVGLRKPHLPFNCPKSYWDLYDPSQIDLTGYTGAQTLPTGTNDFTAAYSGEPSSYGDIAGIPTAAEARHLIHGYMACVSFADAQIGRLLDALDDPDGNPATDDSIANNTVIVLWGDHGWHLGDHNGFWAKHSNYEQATRVPLIITAPGMDTLESAGRKCTAPVELVDVFPTLAEVCSLPLPTQPENTALHGTSLMPLLEDPDQPWKKGAFSQYQRNINGPGVTDNGPGMGYSIRTDRYRYTEWWRTTSTDGTLDYAEIIGTSPEHIELYDYLTDPEETVNLAADPAYASLIAELSGYLNDSDPAFSGDGWKQASVDAPAEFPETYNLWRATHHFPGHPNNLLDSDNDADNDGWPNLAEYKFGTHPLVADAPNILTWLDGNGLNISYPEVVDRTGATITPKSSTDLATWSDSGLLDNPDQGQSGNAVIKSKRSPSTGLPQLFLRLELR